MAFSPDFYKKHFPVFDANPGWIYLDHAATTQKPQLVIDRIRDFYAKEYATVHRGIYKQAAAATSAYESVRDKVAEFLHAASREEIIFTKGATESINLISRGFLAQRLKEGDEILISAMEHHANLIPWQQLCLEKKAILRVIPLNSKGELDLERYWDLLTPRTKMIAFVHVSNTLGTINPVKRLVTLARSKQIPVLIDGSQAVAHEMVNLEELNPDFYVFSAHKIFGPSGVGVAYIKREQQEEMKPLMWGGDMIKSVTFEETIPADGPSRFEAGTPNMAGVIGLGAAIDYINSLDRIEIKVYLKELARYVYDMLKDIKGIRIMGNATERSPIFSFSFEDIHPHDMATFLDSRNIAIRAGHHCTQPLMDHYQVGATARASFSFINNKSEVGKLVSSLEEMIQFFA
ncbi:MAG: cysteine desulfurase [Bacteroidia bacterium]|nr:cysteine desulfurase [Bacteroidia bacterium]